MFHHKAPVKERHIVDVIWIFKVANKVAHRLTQDAQATNLLECLQNSAPNFVKQMAVDELQQSYINIFVCPSQKIFFPCGFYDNMFKDQINLDISCSKI